jgi:hypothetical protein
MQQLKTIISSIFLFLCIHTNAQNALTYDEVNSKSYTLYEKGAWKDLLAYGKVAIAGGQDFSLLRLRLGYAAFMLTNYSEAIKQYDEVLKNDFYNSTAHYYTRLCRLYLNQPELADTGVKYLVKEVAEQEKLKPLAFTQAGVEISHKQTNARARQNTLYARIDISNRFNWNIHLQQSIATYQQKLSEPLLTAIANNQNISINQFEYYNKLTVNLNRKWQLKGAYHYLRTPFNNYVYNNHLGLFGIKYNSNYIDLQADVILGTVTDSAFQQYNFTAGYYPFGNLNLYGFSTVTIKPVTQNAFIFKQVIGAKLLNNIWLEGHATVGKFRNLAENDALYLYNAIDPDTFKGGITTYLSLSKKCIAQLGYTFEQRELYKKTNTFNQHSITGGISWKL